MTLPAISRGPAPDDPRRIWLVIFPRWTVDSGCPKPSSTASRRPSSSLLYGMRCTLDHFDIERDDDGRATRAWAVVEMNGRAAVGGLQLQHHGRQRAPARTRRNLYPRRQPEQHQRRPLPHHDRRTEGGRRKRALRHPCRQGAARSRLVRGGRRRSGALPRRARCPPYRWGDARLRSGQARIHRRARAHAAAARAGATRHRQELLDCLCHPRPHPGRDGRQSRLPRPPQLQDPRGHRRAAAERRRGAGRARAEVGHAPGAHAGVLRRAPAAPAALPVASQGRCSRRSDAGAERQGTGRRTAESGRSTSRQSMAGGGRHPAASTA